MANTIVDIKNLDRAIALLSKNGAIRSALVKSVKEGLKKCRKPLTNMAAEAVQRKFPRLSKSEIIGAQNKSKTPGKSKVGVGWFKITQNLRGRSIAGLEVVLGVRDRRLSLSRLLVGALKPRKQAGIPVARRTKLKATMEGGRVKTLPGAFVAMSSQGKYQVFERVKKGGARTGGYPRTHKKIKLASIRSIHYLFTEPGFVDRIRRPIRGKLQTMIMQNLGKHMAKAKAKFAA